MRAIETSPLSAIRISGKESLTNLLSRKIRYFEENWRKEGLPPDWFKLNEIGFSMDSQMNLLEGLDKRSKLVWLARTKRDILGFGLEYLRQEVIFPFEYEIKDSYGEVELIDPKYGKRLLDTVSEKEREGSVKSSLQVIQRHLLKEEESSAVMVSPLGWTGLKTDRKEDIIYKDTQIYFFKRKGNKVVGTTFRTDFNYDETREVIRILSGKQLPQNASVIDYVSAISLDTSSTQRQEEDIVLALFKARRNVGGENQLVYQDKTWRDMFYALSNRNSLYEFDKQIKQIINEFEDYVILNNLSRNEIRKALAVTILRISRHALFNKKAEEVKEPFLAGGLIEEDTEYIPYGKVFEKVKELPGCAGGGAKASFIESITNRGVSLSQDFGYDFDQRGPCRRCGRNINCGPCGICRACDLAIRKETA